MNHYSKFSPSDRLPRQYPQAIMALQVALIKARKEIGLDISSGVQHEPAGNLFPMQAKDVGVNHEHETLFFRLPVPDREFMQHCTYLGGRVTNLEDYRHVAAEVVAITAAEQLPRSMVGHNLTNQNVKTQFVDEEGNTVNPLKMQDKSDEDRARSSLYVWYDLREKVIPFLNDANEEWLSQRERDTRYASWATEEQTVADALAKQVPLALPAPKPIAEEDYPSLMQLLRHALREARFKIGIDVDDHDGGQIPAHATIAEYQDADVGLNPASRHVDITIPIPNADYFLNNQTFARLMSYREMVSKTIEQIVRPYIRESWDKYAFPQIKIRYADENGNSVAERILAFGDLDNGILPMSNQEKAEYTLHLLIEANEHQFQTFLQQAEEECRSKMNGQAEEQAFGVDVPEHEADAELEGENFNDSAFANWFGSDEMTADLDNEAKAWLDGTSDENWRGDDDDDKAQAL